MLLMFEGTYELGEKGIRYFESHEACHEWVMSEENRKEMIRNYKGGDVHMVTPLCIVKTRQSDLLVNYVKTGI